MLKKYGQIVISMVNVLSTRSDHFCDEASVRKNGTMSHFLCVTGFYDAVTIFPIFSSICPWPL